MPSLVIPQKMTKFRLKIEIIGNKVSLSLLDEKKKTTDELSWIDKRDLSEKLLKNIDSLLRRNGLSIDSIRGVDFYCDSPYFQKKQELDIDENLSYKRRCGFTAWQIGEITARTLNFGLTKKHIPT